MTPAGEPVPIKRDPNLLSAPSLAAYDIRLVCNAIKRSAALLATALVTGSDSAEILRAAETMTLALLKEAGVPPEAQREGHYAYAVMMEAVSVTIEAVAATSKGRALIEADLARAANNAVGLFVELIRSKQVARIADTAWSGDIENSSALRLAICTSLMPLSVAMTEFSFGRQPKQILQEAAKLVAKTAISGADRISPPQATAAARTVLQQSMLNSCAKVFLAIWRAESQSAIRKLSAMPNQDRQAALAALSSRPLDELMQELGERLETSFSTVVDISLELVPLGDQIARDLKPSKLTPLQAVPKPNGTLQSENVVADTPKPWTRKWAR